jgi:NTP pyrophosphatase (non-canonical NTP hydrolase)
MDIKELIAKIDNFGLADACYWGNALAGETGELCNLIKKLARDGRFVKDEFEDEIADVFIYLALAANFFKVDIESAVLKKIEIVRKRRKVKAS